MSTEAPRSEADQRLLEQVALTLVLCDRSAVIAGEAAEGAVALREVLADRVRPGRALAEEAWRALQGTGPLESAGEGKLAFASDADRDALAAACLQRSGASDQQLESLLLDPWSDDPRVVPRLRGLAAALLDVRLSLRIPLARRDPQTALRSDHSRWETDERAALVDALVTHSRDGSLAPQREDLERLEGLAHPGLAEQLDPLIRDQSGPALLRLLSLEIAEAATVPTVADSLLQVALDEEERNEVREAAARAFVASTAPEQHAQLRPLLSVDPSADFDGQLRGTALRAMWRAGALGIDELLRTLEGGSNRYFFGAFLGFMSRPELPAEILERCGPPGLASLVRWSIALLPWFHAGHTQVALAQEGLRLALRHVDESEVRSEVARLLWAAAQAHETAPHDMAATLSEEARRSLLVQVLENATAATSASYWAIAKIVHETDIPWLLGIVFDPGSPKAAVELLAQLHEVDAADIVDLYWSCPERMQALRRRIESSWSAESSTARRELDDIDRQREERTAASRIRPPLMTRLQQLAGFAEEHPLPVWTETVQQLALGPDEQEHGYPLRGPVSDLPGWAALDEAWQDTLRQWARKALESGDPQVEQWISTRGIPGDALAALLALELMHIDGTVASLSDETLTRWAPVVMRLWELRSGAPLPVELRDTIRARVPDALAEAARRVLLDAREPVDVALRVREVERFWVVGAEEALLQLWKRHDLPAESKQVVVSALVSGGSAAGLERAEQALELFAKHRTNRYDAIASAVAFARLDLARYWPLLEGAAKADAQFALDWLGPLAEEERRNHDWLNGLAENNLGVILRILVGRFPSFHRPGGARFLGRSDFLVMLRDSILERLVRHGTWKAVRELEEAAKLLPDPDVLRWSIERARDLAREHSTPALTPQDVHRLVASPRAAVVRGSAALRRAVHRILVEASVDWQPFWQRSEDGAFWPRDGERLEALVRETMADFFHGATVPEVDVRSAGGNTIRVAAPAKGGAEPPSVDIRLVPGWADDLRSAAAGASLVLGLWFGTERWGGGDERRFVAARRGPEDFRSLVRSVRGSAVIWDMSVHETREMLAKALPFGGALLRALDAAGVQVQEVRSHGSDDTWHLAVAWPERLRDRFGLAPRGLIVAVAGQPSAKHTNQARTVLLASPGDMDLDLLIVASDALGLEARLDQLPARWGQWVAWSFANTAAEDLGQAMAQRMPTWEIFDQLDPVRLSQFYGREDEVAHLRRSILAGRSVGVYGIRKVGKTSLVRYVTDDLDPLSRDLYSKDQAAAQPSGAVRVVWVDMQGVGKERGDIEAVLGDRLRRRMAREGSSLGETPSPGAALESILADADRSLCIVLDEYDYAFEPIPTPGFAAILASLRAQAQQTRRLSVLLIGRDPRHLEAPMLEGAPNPLLSWCTEHWVRPMKPNAVSQMLRQLGLRVGLQVGDATVEAALAWTGGHPQLARQLGAAVQEVARREQRVDTDAILDDALDVFPERSSVRTTVNEVEDLLRRRYPAAWLLITGQPLDDIGRRRGRLWLRNFGLVDKDLRLWRLLDEGSSRTASGGPGNHDDWQESIRLEQREPEDPPAP